MDRIKVVAWKYLSGLHTGRNGQAGSSGNDVALNAREWTHMPVEARFSAAELKPTLHPRGRWQLIRKAGMLKMFIRKLRSQGYRQHGSTHMSGV